MVGVRLTHRCDDLGFGSAIDIGDEIIAGFARDFEAIESAQTAHYDLASLARRAHGDVN
jgi:hypothetical protein